MMNFYDLYEETLHEVDAPQFQVSRGQCFGREVLFILSLISKENVNVAMCGHIIHFRFPLA